MLTPGFTGDLRRMHCRDLPRYRTGATGHDPEDGITGQLRLAVNSRIDRAFRQFLARIRTALGLSEAGQE
jgi:hypothetical protein